jgi:hypothetical protein
VLAHAGEATPARLAFQALPAATQDAVIEFLKTLQVLPPGTQERIVDEHYQPRPWPPPLLATGEQPIAPRSALAARQPERREP